LSIDFNVHQADYIPLALASGVGARVTITDPSAAFSIRPREHGYNTRPHTMTDFAIKVHETIRLPEPYTSKCWKNWNESFLIPEDRVADVKMFMMRRLKYLKSNATQAYSYSVSGRFLVF
jgi:hypothetical protein